jgi:hypothetical protein
MSAGADEISSLARTADQALSDAEATVAEATGLAAELGERAAGHGWERIAAAMGQVQDDLVTVGEAIHDSRTAIGNGLGHLSVITDETSSDEVARLLAGGATALGTARASADVALRRLTDPRDRAQEVDAARCDEILRAAEEDVSKARELVRAAIERTASEHAAAATWGTPVATEGPAPRAEADGRLISGVGAGGEERRHAPSKTDRLKEHLTDRDLDAARRELDGEIVARKPDGTPWDHVREVREAQVGLVNRINRLKRQLGDSRTADVDKPQLQTELAEASRLLDHSEGFVPRQVAKSP